MRLNQDDIIFPGDPAHLGRYNFAPYENDLINICHFCRANRLYITKTSQEKYIGVIERKNIAKQVGCKPIGNSSGKIGIVTDDFSVK